MRYITAFGVLLLVSESAAAHAFGTPYNLPVPFWLYVYGASAALLLSFLISANFAKEPVSTHVDVAGSERPHRRFVLSAGIVSTLRLCSCSALFLSIFAGLVGSRDVDLNINMTLFWIVFSLAFYYLTAFIGDLYNVINPWRSLCSYFERLAPYAFVARIRLPDRLRYCPALVLYIAYIWVELFGATQPHSIALILIGYTAINLSAAALVGKDIWFSYGEFFSVLFRLAGMLAPIEYIQDGHRTVRVRFRRPLSALSASRVESVGLLFFILFALSSTAFDGFHETRPWVTVFWKDIYPVLKSALAQPYQKLVAFYYYWQWTALIASPIFYFGLYMMFIWLAKRSAKSTLSLCAFALCFAYSLVPIALAYNAAHYFSLVVSQGAEMVRLVSDPFGFGWNLFGTAHLLETPVILGAGGTWHAQVTLIVLGHILGVYVAHVEALRLFANARRAMLSQLPMLVLMMLFTTLGLWILSLPISAGGVVQPG